jgi:cytochrome c oxidase subunit 4
MTEHVESRTTYVVVFIALLILLVLSIIVARFDLGYANTFVALAISMVKTVLIMLYFMHLRHSSALLRVVALGGLLWLAIMIILAFSDYPTRSWGSDGWSSQRAVQEQSWGEPSNDESGNGNR